MTIFVQTPDGGSAQFPDGTLHDDIVKAMDQAFPNPAAPIGPNSIVR